MTYSLPFGLKQKPLNHYFENGVVRFSCRDGKLFYEIKHITKTVNAIAIKGIVSSKEKLDALINIKYISEIPTIEVETQ